MAGRMPGTDRTRAAVGLAVAAVLVTLGAGPVQARPATAAPGWTLRTITSSPGDAVGTLALDSRHVLVNARPSDLVGGPNEAVNAFIHDLRFGGTAGVTDANGVTRGVELSADGGTLLLTSAATDLVASHTTATPDVVLKGPGPAITQVTAGNRASTAQGMSADGRWTVLISRATTLVPGPDTATPDVYLYDRASATTTRVSDQRAAAVAARISPDAATIAYTTADPATGGATRLTLIDRAGGTAREVALPTGCALTGCTVTLGGFAAGSRYLTFTVDTAVPGTAARRLMLLDVATGRSALVVASAGTQLAGLPSGDGRYVAVVGNGTDLVPGLAVTRARVYRWDRATGTSTLLVDPNRPGTVLGGISRDGTRIVFTSAATNLDPRNSDGTREVYAVLTG